MAGCLSPPGRNALRTAAAAADTLIDIAIADARASILDIDAAIATFCARSAAAAAPPRPPPAAVPRAAPLRRSQRQQPTCGIHNFEIEYSVLYTVSRAKREYRLNTVYL